MNGIKSNKPAGQHWNILLDSVVKMITYKIITINHAIYVNLFSSSIWYYLTVSMDVVLNANNKDEEL